MAEQRAPARCSCTIESVLSAALDRPETRVPALSFSPVAALHSLRIAQSGDPVFGVIQDFKDSLQCSRVDPTATALRLNEWQPFPRQLHLRTLFFPTC
jgi:hypothetical protein